MAHDELPSWAVPVLVAADFELITAPHVALRSLNAGFIANAGGFEKQSRLSAPARFCRAPALAFFKKCESLQALILNGRRRLIGALKPFSFGCWQK
jgi:hypothetical protein